MEVGAAGRIKPLMLQRKCEEQVREGNEEDRADAEDPPAGGQEPAQGEATRRRPLHISAKDPPAGQRAWPSAGRGVEGREHPPGATRSCGGGGAPRAKKKEAGGGVEGERVEATAPPSWTECPPHKEDLLARFAFVPGRGWL